MKTQILKPTKTAIEKACKLIMAGEVVAVPTETVYGLAGSSFDSKAIKKIFIAKGRPQDNPLIVHISNIQQLKDVVSVVPQDAQKLAEAFWPGPLTIIMPKNSKLAPETSAGLDSVGVRMPSHPVAKQIIEKTGPFSAPSANISGRPSPTTAEDVFADMNGRIPLIIDGGECDAGVESTVVSCLEDTPIILRPGVVTKSMMEQILNKKVKIAKAITQEVKENQKVLSPGMKYKHYAPNAKVVLIKSNLNQFIKYVHAHASTDTFVLVFDGEQKHFNTKALTYGKIDDQKAQAHNIFACLRQLDKLGAKEVFVRCPSANDIGLAVYNRLIRSSGFNIIEL